MKKSFKKPIGVLSLILSAGIATSSLAGCGVGSNSGTADTAKTGTFTDSGVAFSVAEDCVVAPAEGTEVAQELHLTSSTPISGTLRAEDVTLDGSFRNMKVSAISNDAETITLTVTGVPEFEEATTIGYKGTIEFPGRYFNTEAATVSFVPVICKSKEKAEGSYFYPFLDSVVDNGGTKEMHILLRPYNGSFKDNPDKANVTLGGILEGGEIVSLTPKEGDLELIVNVTPPADTDAKTQLGSITLPAGSMSDADGKDNTQELSYTRDFSSDTVGRGLSGYDLKRIKDTLQPKKDIPDILKFDDIGNLFNYGTMIYSYYGTAMTAYKGISSMLAAFGIIQKGPSAEEKRHQELMEALSGISGQIEAMQEDVTAVRSYAVDNKRLLENLSLITIEDDLAVFHSHYDAMIKYTNEIEDALRDNEDAILALAEAHYVEGEEGREMTDEELEKIIRDFGAEICNLRQSNYSTIGEKMKLVEEEYTKAMTYMKNNNANPISRYCQKYQFVDNFSTTSVVDKELYAIDLDCQFDRTLSYLMLLGGKTSQTQNINMYMDSYFPDVEAEATNENGDPYCYLMGNYVQIADSTSIYKSKEEYRTLQTEDIKEFGSRRNGRSLKEELVLAGFDESAFTEQYTTFNDSDLGTEIMKEYTYSGVREYDSKGQNERFRGLAFSFKPRYGNYPLDFDNTPIEWFTRMDGKFNYMTDDKHSFVVDGEGFYYENDGYNGQYNVIPCAGYMSKPASKWHSAGWYIIEPLAYLKPV